MFLQKPLLEVFVLILFIYLLPLPSGAQMTGTSQFDVPRICAENARFYVLDSNRMLWKLPPDLFENGTAPEIAQAIAKLNPPWLKIIAPWLLQDPTSLQISGAGFILQAYLAQNLVDRLVPGKKIESILTDAASHPAVYSPEALAQAKKVMDSIRSVPPISNIEKVKRAAPLLCAQYKDFGCASALRDLMDQMGTRVLSGAGVGYYSSVPDALERLFLDARMVQGSAHFALKIWKRFQSKNWQQNQIHLFDDMKDSFMKTGSPPALAAEFTWALLGVYGARGASVAVMGELVNKENLPVFLNLYLFSAALGVMDTNSLRSMHPYSYPAVITTQCAYGNPYHYWLPAYLTHYLVSKGHNPKSAMIAAHLSAKLYEFEASTINRNPNQVYYEKFFSPLAVYIQKNMAFTDAAAFWVGRSGATFGPHGPIVPDQGLLKIFRAARPLPVTTKEEIDRGLKNPLTKYRWFHRLIAPDTYLKEFTFVQDEPDYGPLF